MTQPSHDAAAASTPASSFIRRFLSVLVQSGMTVAIALGVVIALALIHMAAGDEPGEKRIRALPVVTQDAVLEGSYEIERRYTALIAAANAADIGFEVGGRVVAVEADIGDRVEAGDPIGRIDTRRLEVRVNSLQAALAEAEANAARATSEFRRQEDLLAGQATSRSRFETARADAQSATATVQRLSADLDAASTDLDDAVLTAPFAGTVTARNFDVGDVVAAGAPVVRLIQSSSREARAALPVSAVGALEPGDAVRVVWNRRDAVATVKSVVPEVNVQTQSATLVVALPPDVTPTIGETITVLLSQTIDTPGFWVPVSALVADLKGLFAVQIVEPTDDGGFTIARAPIEILYTDGERAFVNGTLEPGDQLVATGANRVSPGQRVTLSRLGSGADL